MYKCPINEDEGSSTVIRLKTRNFNFIVGGCNPTSKGYLKNSIYLAKAVLFYTNYDPGSECEEYMYIYI